VLHEVEGRKTRQPLGQRDWVGDRGAGHQEPGLGAVVCRGPAQPAQHVADVGAEHAAIDVGLIDDDERQVGDRSPQAS